MVSVDKDGTASCIPAQSPVNNTCLEGFSISKIAKDGSVSCEKGGPSFDRRTHYVTWGKQQCEGEGELVFSGWMVGPWYYRKGGPVQHECLPYNNDVPGSGQWDKDRTQTFGGLYRRAEFRDQYQLKVNPDFQLDHNKAINYMDLPCAVCVAKEPAHIMVPGSVECPSGYRKDYRGYLTASRFNEATTAGFTCLHEYMQRLPRSSNGNQYGSRVYPTEYNGFDANQNWNDAKNNFEVSCAECTAESNDKPLSTYTRWGKNSCGKEARTLYAGWVANARNTNSGGGATYQCMNMNLGYTGAERRQAKYGGLLSEVQYDTHSASVSAAWKKVDGYEVPCAVCEVEAQSTVMIPGREECPTGYEASYTGWIASGYFTHRHVTENICVDVAPDVVPGSSRTKRNVGRLYAAEVFRAADSVKGKEYKDGQEIPCTQCSAAKAKKTSVYTTWGRKKCPAKSGTLYSGWMGNTLANFPGGGHNYLCMANAGQKGKGANPKRNYGGQVAHVDYRQSKASGKAGKGGPGNKRATVMHGHDASCSVCEVEAEDVKMFPGLTKCPAGYNTLYAGYLMTGWYDDNHDTSAVCVEKNFEPVDKSKKGTVDGAGMYVSELQSPVSGQAAGYVHNGEMTCAVCSL